MLLPRSTNTIIKYLLLLAMRTFIIIIIIVNIKAGSVLSSSITFLRNKTVPETNAIEATSGASGLRQEQPNLSSFGRCHDKLPENGTRPGNLTFALYTCDNSVRCPKPAQPVDLFPVGYGCCRRVSSRVPVRVPSDDCCLIYYGPNGARSSCCRVRVDADGIPSIEHCCPFPYLAFGENSCCFPWGDLTSCCKLPQLPSGDSCMEPGFAQSLEDRDVPLYELRPPSYMPSSSEPVRSNQEVCYMDEIVRQAFGVRLQGRDRDGQAGVPTRWSPFLGISMTFQNDKFLQYLLDWEERELWPDVIMPFLFPFVVILAAALSAVLFLILGAIVWTILFNIFRLLGHRKIRMAIRALLVQKEKLRRSKIENSFPPEDLRKFVKQHRYQMPKAFQDSNISDDDEPAELRRERITRAPKSLFSQKEIERLGFDPDNIPIEWIYGDLLGVPHQLKVDVKKYREMKSRLLARGGMEEDSDQGGLESDEWDDFLLNRPSMDRTKMRKTALHTSNFTYKVNKRIDSAKKRINKTNSLGSTDRSLERARKNQPGPSSGLAKK